MKAEKGGVVVVANSEEVVVVDVQDSDESERQKRECSRKHPDNQDTPRDIHWGSASYGRLERV